MIKLGIIMDPISSINIKKDSSFAMLLEANIRGYEIHYMEVNSLYIQNGKAKAFTRIISVKNNNNIWYKFHNEQNINLEELDVILMRKDPPFNTEFIYATYILECAENKGVLIINKPKSLRDCNEKVFTAIQFSKYAPNTLISRRNDQIKNFCKENGDSIIKPLDGMGGKSIFLIKKNDPNTTVIIESLTNEGKKFCIIQNFLSEVKKYGDKRIIIVDGKPVPYCLSRIPKNNEIRGNLSAGGFGVALPIGKDDLKLVNKISPILKEKGLMFVGIDIISNYLIEINITSPTCIKEIESVFPISITGILMDAIEKNIYIKN